MSVLLVEDSEVTVGDFLLHDADFPKGYVHMKHPDDAVVTEQAIAPVLTRHKRAHHHRLLLRVLFKLQDGNFVAFTFVCDTGAPDSMYRYLETDEILFEGGRRIEDDAGNTFINILGNRAATRETPRTHQPAKTIGLTLLEHLGLSLEDRFTLKKSFDFF
jgi:hypothetical protein